MKSDENAQGMIITISIFKNIPSHMPSKGLHKDPSFWAITAVDKNKKKVRYVINIMYITFSQTEETL